MAYLCFTQTGAPIPIYLNGSILHPIHTCCEINRLYSSKKLLFADFIHNNTYINEQLGKYTPFIRNHQFHRQNSSIKTSERPLSVSFDSCVKLFRRVSGDSPPYPVRDILLFIIVLSCFQITNS